mmetsp:Transcript_13787/g.14979  ORF Transcript_13787/g.14979 Transcript_13787/m.14979 type:complete len:192 (+) Transcript_13787:19-594(+)|eukprot:CAMPEP_0173150112 /NCGR_PEP_ID=MMETSP1105-20130129/10756_1 /TAXON_ID=2985 /ORGANISM="Ochromonas sp., Strain BG-1" /LENGTH=191 /DNA_ID=CAMNT_0014065165 /DNA_START=19 /DNA_END=594 /DNA_ORIENTATION=+
MNITLPEIRAALERNGVHFVEEPPVGNNVIIRVDGAVIIFNSDTGTAQVQGERQNQYEQILTGGGDWFNYVKNNRVAQLAVVATVGYVTAPLLVSGGFSAIGLSSTGPVSGGWFALNMGAGLTAGGAMASIQSAAMRPSTYRTASWVGSAFAASSWYTANEYFRNRNGQNQQNGNEADENGANPDVHKKNE